MSAIRRDVLVSALALAVAGCGGAFRPFALRPVVWRDDDTRPFEPAPSELYTAPRWDTVDHTLFRQLSRYAAFDLASREAIDVNALDEVPSSSWFENRIGVHPMSDDELYRGACAPGEAWEPPRPWVVVRGKPGGTTPGVVIRSADGRRYLFKVDFWGQPGRATAADAISTRMLYAAGYYTPCDTVVAFTPDFFEIDPEARASGTSQPYTQADLDELIEAAQENPDGTRRGSLSLYLDGEPLGGWRFDGVTPDDPNDVVPHQHRREVRGLYVFSAWLNHIDARAENNMSLWVHTDARHGYVRHYVLDAGDSFGIVWGDDLYYGMSARFGHSHYLDTQHVLEDFISLGMVPRAYRDPPHGPAFEVFGFYDVERFVPDAWRANYPNPAFEQMTERDAAWAARIVSRMDRHAIEVIARSGRFTRPDVERELVRIVMGRRRRILERWLTRLSPLAEPVVEGGSLCLRDLAVESGTRPARTRRYSATAYAHVPPDPDSAVAVTIARPGRVCARLPEREGEAPLYEIVDVTATSGEDHTGPARVHLYRLPSGEHRVVGLERPPAGAPP